MGDFIGSDDLARANNSGAPPRRGASSAYAVEDIYSTTAETDLGLLRPTAGTQVVNSSANVNFQALAHAPRPGAAGDLEDIEL